LPAHLVEAIRPWLGQLVVVGGWAQRLYRFHPLASPPTYWPIRTRDADLAFSLDAPLSGDLGAALEKAGVCPGAFRGACPPVIHYPEREPRKKAQDLLYIHDTIELFGGSLDTLADLWGSTVRPALPGRTGRRTERIARELTEDVTDTIREASRIPQDRRPLPEDLRAACHIGLEAILGPW
jgi:hypothetical protein